MRQRGAVVGGVALLLALGAAAITLGGEGLNAWVQTARAQGWQLVGRSRPGELAGGEGPTRRGEPTSPAAENPGGLLDPILGEAVSFPEKAEEEEVGGGESPVSLEVDPDLIDLVPGYEPMAVEAKEPLLPEPPANLPAMWQGLQERVYEIAADFPGRLSVVAIDLTSGSRYEFRPNDPYLPASTFKLPVTLCTLEAIQRGELSWESLVTYTEEDDEPVGAGLFATSPFGGQYSIRNLVDRSLISSNNVAVKMLARQLTWDGLLDCTTQIGGPVTRTEEGSTPVTASYEAAWWLHLYKLYQQDPQVAEQLLRPLRQVTYYGRIQAGTPASHLVTHKFGTYAGHDHDGAIVWAERPYALVVMTYGAGEYRADRAIEEIAAATWTAVMAGSQ